MDATKLSWTEFKALIDTWKIKSLIRFTPKNGDGNYDQVWVNFEGNGFIVNGGIVSGSQELTDFEANYEPNAAQTWVAGKDVSRNDIAFTFNINPGSSTQSDFKVASDSFIWDGELSVRGSSSLDGDSIAVQVVDVDGVYAPAGTILGAPINKKFLEGARSVSARNPDGSPMFIPANVYLRVIYDETQGSAKVGDVNLEVMN